MITRNTFDLIVNVENIPVAYLLIGGLKEIAFRLYRINVDIRIESFHEYLKEFRYVFFHDFESNSKMCA